MEQNLHKRVYINPNFKRTEIDCWPTKPIQTMHINRHYLKELPNRETYTEINRTISNNRKIYVNPSFINNTTQSNQRKLPTGAEYRNMHNVPNRPLIHKSKYSLVQNLKQNVINTDQAVMEINKYNTSKISPDFHKIAKKPSQEVPLTKSRYCIIRKEKRLSVNIECKSVNNLATEPKTANKSSVSNACTHLIPVKNSLKNKLNHNAPEKIPKIKITRYKMVPVSYLKKYTATETNQNKFVASTFKSNFKSNTKLGSSVNNCHRNRFKFIKTTPPVSTIKTPLRITKHKDKGVLSGGSKLKLLKAARAKFNINNIPCRLFTKYGKCLRQVQGHCKYLHDVKHVSLCHKFLKGICHDKNCTLSHELTDKKMPTCHFYLKGMCTKECCPYLHVKLSDKTKICQEFVKGYCESGDKCLFRHVNIEKLKIVKKASLNSSQVRVTRTKHNPTKDTENCEAMKNSSETMENDGECRYYKELMNSDDSYESIKPTRCKLGMLPSFIQL